jgi:hypothetical protein
VLLRPRFPKARRPFTPPKPLVIAGQCLGHTRRPRACDGGAKGALASLRKRRSLASKSYAAVFSLNFCEFHGISLKPCWKIRTEAKAHLPAASRLASAAKPPVHRFATKRRTSALLEYHLRKTSALLEYHLRKTSPLLELLRVGRPPYSRLFRLFRVIKGGNKL